jgi:hypothetical protein
MTRSAPRVRRRLGRLVHAVPTGLQLVPAAVAAAIVEVGLRTVPLPRLAGLLGVALPAHADNDVPRSGPDAQPAVLDLRYRPRVRAAVAVTEAWPFGGDGMCLRRSLIVGSRLRRLRPLLRIGIIKDGDVVKAHAWLEVGGRSMDVGDERYEVLRPIGQRPA